MTARPIVPLSELFASYDTTAPQTLMSIWEADIETLPVEARELRRQLLEARNAFDQAPILTPEDLADLIEKGRLRLLASQWLVVPLAADRRRVLGPVLTDDAVAGIATAATAGPDGLARRVRKLLAEPGAYRWAYQSLLSRSVPDPEELATTCPLPTGGTYVVLYGGSPEVLDEHDTATELEALLRSHPVSDVVFRHLTSNAAPALYSLGCGRGEQAGTAIPFPNQDLVVRLRAGLRKGA